MAAINPMMLVALALLPSACARSRAPVSSTAPNRAPHATFAVEANAGKAGSDRAERVGPDRETPKQKTKNGLTWYEDAAPEAFAAAAASGKLVLADLWAPWCHTCLSMQNSVLTSANLPRASDHYVLLAIDTERAENAEFLETFPVGVWPTFYAISVDPDGRKAPEVVGRWLGAAAPGSFARFLDDNARVAELSTPRAGGPTDPLALVRAGDRLATEKKFAEAAQAYGDALAQAPPIFPRRAATLVSRISALVKAKDIPSCLALARAAMGQTGSSPSAVDFASYALDCAAEASVDPRIATDVRRAVALRLAPLCKHGSPELSPDDQADACDRLHEAHDVLGDRAGAREASLQRLAILEAAAQGLPDDVAVTYDWARVDTQLLLGRSEEALALCIGRARALPQNYNPPAYQARIYRELRRWNDGLMAIERALALAYGPRRIGLLSLKADLLLGAGRKDEARAVLEEQLASYRALPAGQKHSAAESRVEQRLKDWR